MSTIAQTLTAHREFAAEQELPPRAIEVVDFDAGSMICENHAFESGRRHFIKMYRKYNGNMQEVEFKCRNKHRLYTAAFTRGWEWQASNTHTL
jgi:hypothetical protein